MSVPQGYTRADYLSDEYNRYMNSLRWAARRFVVKFLAGYRPNWWKGGPQPARCQFHRLPNTGFRGRCTSTLRVQVHHLTYKRFKHEPLRDLLPLCKRHHMEVHGREAPRY